ncbi:ligase-associated DNA damage response endonuclease PdeM [bacterium]|nr:ligase-associated DNA damage response endonuclease PdeM [bacterium]
MSKATNKRASIEIELAGEQVRLLADRALFWPRERTLFIADPHFGKGTTFRRFGLAVPDDTANELQRLSNLLKSTEARQLIILGDFLHARAGSTNQLFDQLIDWRSQHAPVAMTLVEGNHDRTAGPFPEELNFEIQTNPIDLGPFNCRHEPEKSNVKHVLSGHVHPAISMRDRNSTSLRSPCFWVQPTITVLPAFGSFTGTEIIQPVDEDRVFVVGEGAVFSLPVP